MYLISFFMTIVLTFTPSSKFLCDGDILSVVIRNNMNGDFNITEDLLAIDKGAFATIDWRKNNLMLPFSFNKGEITFTDKKWLWSYQDNQNGLISETPRLAHKLGNGNVKEYFCEAIY